MESILAVSDPAVNPALGILIFMLGGLAGAVFYLPFKKVTQWAWESYWFVYALFGLVIVPWVLAFITAPEVISILKAAPSDELTRCYIFGAMWGFGGLTWGLMIRYLGVGLGLALGCGICSAAGTLLPPIFKGQIASLTATNSACVALLGVVISVIGIVLIGCAGISKEKELPEEEKKKAVAEYSFKKGIIAALFSGLMSAGMAFGLQSGSEIESIALLKGTAATWKGMPVLVVVLLGGFTVNGIWCLCLNFKNKTIGDYTNFKAPLIGNIIFAGIAGAIWVMQFVCNKTGEPSMGEFAYVGWAVLMASSILFSTILGIFLGEWKGTGGRTKTLLAIGIAVLLGSSIITGWSGYLKKDTASAPVTTEESALNSLSENLTKSSDSLKATGEKVSSDLKTAAEELKSAAKSVSNDAKDAAKNISEQAKSTAEKVANDTKEAIENVKNEAKATIEELKGKSNTTVIKVDPSLTNAPVPPAPTPAPAPATGLSSDR